MHNMYKKDKIEHFQSSTSSKSRNLYILLLVLLSIMAVVVGFLLFKNPPPASEPVGIEKLLKG